MKRILIIMIGLYQRIISPMLPRSCRFYPSCSSYAKEAIRSHSVGRGVVLMIRRLSKCHPWNPGGWDPVPMGKNERGVTA